MSLPTAKLTVVLPRLGMDSKTLAAELKVFCEEVIEMRFPMYAWRQMGYQAHMRATVVRLEILDVIRVD